MTLQFSWVVEEICPSPGTTALLISSMFTGYSMCEMTQKCIFTHSGMQSTGTASSALHVCPGRQRTRNAFPCTATTKPFADYFELAQPISLQTQPHGHQQHSSNPANCHASLGDFALEQCKSVYESSVWLPWVLYPTPSNWCASLVSVGHDDFYLWSLMFPF